MSDHVVLDVEIQKTIEETPGGWDATDKLGVSCAVTYDYRKDRFRIWGPGDVDALRHRLLQADRITGFNIWRFDLPVIWGISRADWPKLSGEGFHPLLRAKTDDLLERIWIALGLSPDEFSELHKGWGLDNVALGTLGRGKIGYGGDAPKLSVLATPLRADVCTGGPPMTTAPRTVQMVPAIAPKYVALFWNRVQKQPGEGCWLWTGKPGRNGYGRAQVAAGVTDYAHRVSWRIHHGTIPEDCHILHRCDTPLCIRPDHLFLGDQGVNNRDMCAKGRHGFQAEPGRSPLVQWMRTHPRRPTRGENHPQAKLTAAAVVQIRAACAAGEAQWKVGARFGVTQITVSRIVRGLLWTDAGGPVLEVPA